MNFYDNTKDFHFYESYQNICMLSFSTSTLYRSNKILVSNLAAYLLFIFKNLFHTNKSNKHLRTLIATLNGLNIIKTVYVYFYEMKQQF